MLTSVLPILGEELGDLVTNLTIRDLDVLLGLARVGHEGQEAIVGDVELYHGVYQYVGPVQVTPGSLLTSWYS